VRSSRVFAVVLRQLYLMRGSPARVVPVFAWVAIDIVLWGFITKYLDGLTAHGFRFVPTLLGAALLWDFFNRTMTGVTIAFFEDVWSRNFLNLFASPLRIAEYVAGLVVSSILTGSIGLAVMLLIAGGVFGLSFVAYGLAFVPFLIVLFLFGIALGIVGCSLVLRLGPATEWFVWAVPALLSPFASVFYPISTLPGWMQAIARLMPPAYVFEGLRTIVAGGSAPIGTLAAAAALAVLDIALAYAFFRSVHRHAVRTGLIARYSAETVS
jgi:ABC-2 type transport system permease protein